MKILYKSSIPCLFALIWMFAACAPQQYGAHFAPSKHAPSVAANSNKQNAPLVAQEPTDTQAAQKERAAVSGASEMSTDAVAPLAAPSAPEMTPKQQRKIIRELRNKLNGMTAQEREQFKNAVRNQLRAQQQSMRISEDDQRDRRATGGDVALVLLIILAIVLPPLAVYLHQGTINAKVIISLVLTLLFLINPFFWTIGIAYAILVIFGIL